MGCFRQRIQDVRRSRGKQEPGTCQELKGKPVWLLRAEEEGGGWRGGEVMHQAASGGLC